VPYNFKLINTGYPAAINDNNFEEIALELFNYQYNNNDMYRLFVQALNIAPASVSSIQKIPFLPISFFRTHKIVTDTHTATPLVFESSGTTGEATSRHYVYDVRLYEEAMLNGFREFYGSPSGYAIIGLLPSYLERKTSSLVHMANVLMEKSGHPENGFYLDEFGKLYEVLQKLEAAKQPAILLGVTFALLDFAEAYPMPLNNTIVMETGGMKGRRTEWTRMQVHEYLQAQWGVKQVHAEYGMTELLSQAYAKKDGLFKCIPSMRVMVRDMNDPLDVSTKGTGCLNIIDLANVHSCAFIATDDIGTIHGNGVFEVLGRADYSALRGCNLMVI
jgi:hypothetical protein